MVNAVEIIYYYEGYPTIIHNEPLHFQIGEPKFWNLHVDTEEGEFINLDYRLAGDTLIQEKEYVRVVFGYEEKADLYENDFLLMSAIRPNGKNYADTLYYRQEEDKVYCLQQEEDKETLVIDYGLEVGDEFTDANGEVFLVKDTARQSQNEYFHPRYYYQPRKLTLVSKQTGEEDIWVEGMGSKYWGITPYFFMARNKVFTKLGLQPSHAQVFMGYGGNALLRPHVNTESYKAEMIDLGGNYSGNDIFLNCEFLDDTLRVEGVKVFEHFAGYSYVECLIEDGRIDIMVKKFNMEDQKREKRYVFDVKIPGFEAGTYEVGMPGREYVILECLGANPTSVESISLSSQKNTLFDLQGRKLQGKPARGIYIENGKKKTVNK
jgi:hypothetical protein